MGPLPSASSRHAVQFYGNERSLYDSVAGFLSEGLIAGQAAIIIATDAHRAGMLDALSSRFIDVERARRGGALVVLDARELMETFLVDGAPDAELFDYNVGLILDQAFRDGGRALIRAYGEIVDVLWKEGHTDAAIKVEMLWNRMAAKYGFALLCGYAMGNFFKKADQLEAICTHHSHVIEPGMPVMPELERTRPRGR